MPLYNYHALNPKGKVRRGLIDASSLQEAKEKLRRQGVLVTRLGEGKRDKRRHALKGQALVTFTTQLAQLIRSGMPVFESLVALEEQARDERYHPILLSLCDQIKAGGSLSNALAKHPQSFSTLFCAMVAAGEAAGTLSHVLHKLSILLTRQLKVRKQVISALTYPAVIAIFCVCVIFLLLTFAIPSIEALFEGATLNTFTALVLRVSHFLSEQWPFYLPLLFGSVVGLRLFFRSPAGRKWWARTQLHLPLVRSLAIEGAWARFCRTLATLQEGGVSIIEALRLSRKVMLQPQLEQLLLQAEEKIIAGSSLSAELKQTPYAPSMMVRMLQVGEESGDLTPMLTQIADLYESEVEQKLTRFSALAQPVILIIMGGLVGLIMLAVLLPLTDATSLM